MDDTNEPDGHSANIHTANSASPATPVTASTPRQTAAGLDLDFGDLPEL